MLSMTTRSSANCTSVILVLDGGDDMGNRGGKDGLYYGGGSGGGWLSIKKVWLGV
jgi:hypothetical protein